MAFTSVQKIRFDDVDGAGIVYYPQFFHLCHAAFEDFFDTAAPLSYPELVKDRRLGFPTVAIESTFKAPLSYGDVVVVELAVLDIGITSVTFGYDIRRKRDGALCFRSRITTVLVRLENMEPVPLTDEFRSIFTRFLSRKDR
ncbi:MAG: acyl-CoA thioesterase [Acidobacteriota bacterium]